MSSGNKGDSRPENTATQDCKIFGRVTWKVIFEAGLVEEFEDQKVRGNTNVFSVAIGCNAGQRVGAWEVQPPTALHAPFSVSHRSVDGSRSSSMLKCGLIYGHST